MKVNILGTEYTLSLEQEGSDRFDTVKADGICDETSKELVFLDIKNTKGYERMGNKDVYIKRIVAHEITHAFLFESGLAYSSDWATNEEIVDWIARQLPKIQVALNQAYEEFKKEGIIDFNKRSEND